MNWFHAWLISQGAFWIMAFCFGFIARANRGLRRELRMAHDALLYAFERSEHGQANGRSDVASTPGEGAERADGY